MEWNRVVLARRDLKDHLVQLPDHFGADEKLNHGITGFVQILLLKALSAMGHQTPL